jgi:dTDP-L-rhamnose 4-epimerase
VSRPVERLRAARWEPVCAACGHEVEAIPTPEDQPLRPTSTYGITKRDQEELCLVLGRAHGLPTIVLRYLNVYGPRQSLSNPYTGVAAIVATRLLNGRAPVIFEDGRQRRDLVHVSDVARANLAAAAADDAACDRPYNIGTGRTVTVLELARLIAARLGKNVPIAPSGEFRAGDIRHCVVDVAAARERLGWRAERRLEAGIGELAAWAAGEAPEDLTERANAELRALRLIESVGASAGRPSGSVAS